MSAKKKQAKKKEGKSKAVKGGKKAPATKAKAAPVKSGDGVLAEPKAKPKGKEKKQVDLTPLKGEMEEAKKALTKAENEANALRMQAKGIDAGAKKAYAEALAPYREACRKAGVECEFAGGRATNVTPAVRFLVEKVKDGVKVVVKGQPETEEVIPLERLKQSIGKAAVAYVEKFIGDKASVGNKQGSLGNRLRAALKTN